MLQFNEWTKVLGQAYPDNTVRNASPLHSALAELKPKLEEAIEAENFFIKARADYIIQGTVPDADREAIKAELEYAKKETTMKKKSNNYTAALKKAGIRNLVRDLERQIKK